MTGGRARCACAVLGARDALYPRATRFGFVHLEQYISKLKHHHPILNLVYVGRVCEEKKNIRGDSTSFDLLKLIANAERAPNRLYGTSIILDTSKSLGGVDAVLFNRVPGELTP